MNRRPSFRVLLVDEDPSVLDGLRRQLRGQRDRWRMEFVGSGTAALAALEREPADVVVTDAPPRGGCGADLLRAVRSRWPATVRIVLSGRSVRSELLGEAGVAHQFLHKPCNTSDLIHAIERAQEVASLLDDEELRAVASSIDALPVGAETYTQLMHAIESDDFGLSDIAAIVEHDIGLTTRLLQLVNSAFFGLGRRVTNLRDAITLVGSDTLRTLAMTSFAFRALADHEPSANSIERLWDASCEIGHIAGRIAEACGARVDHIERARLAGALSLVGRGVLLREFPDRFAHAQASARPLNLRLHEAEAVEFGAGQQLIGAYALGVWGFDDDLIAAVMFQATPELCETTSPHPLAMLVHLARSCVAASILVEQFEPSPAALERLGLDPDFLMRLEVAA